MKLKILTLGSTVVLFSLFVIYSCNKRDISRLAEESNVSSGLIQAAKDWYSKQIAAKNTTLSSTNTTKHYLPANWKESSLVTLKNGRTVLVVSSSLPIKLNEQSKIGVIRKIVFQLNGNEITGGKILELFGTRDYIEKNKGDLLEKFISKSIHDFTGTIIYYDINYKYISSSSFKNGKNQNARSRVGFDKGEHQKEKTNTGMMTLDEVCTHFYLVDIYSDGTEVWTYLWTDCYDDGNNSELGGYYEESQYYYASGPASTDTSPVGLQITYLDDPCKIFALEMIHDPMYGDFENTISQIYRNFSLAESQVNLVFREVDFSDAPGKTSQIGTNSYQIALSNVYFNQPGYQMSREAWGLIIAHELCHVIILDKGLELPFDPTQHFLMFTKFVDPIKECLMASFGLNSQTALLLAISGVGDLFEKWGAANFDSACQTYYGVNKAQSDAAFDYYTKPLSMGGGGIKCN